MRPCPPAPGEVRLWWIGPGAAPRGDPAEESVLAEDELARARLMTDPAARTAFVRRRAALRTVLGGCLGVPARDVRFAVGRHGKPRLTGPRQGGRLVFSVSRAGPWALIGIARSGALGVDVEWTGGAVDACGLARRFLPHLDLARVPAERRQEVFFRAWTRYEATIKAAGSALGRPPGRRSSTWTVLHPAAPPRHTAALVTAGPPLTLTVRILSGPGPGPATARHAPPQESRFSHDHGPGTHDGPIRHR
ncbi:4'-phosphopantetheinyl transferase family protein [Streptomyces sp. NPDC001348]